MTPPKGKVQLGNSAAQPRLEMLSRYVVAKTGLKYLDEKPEDLVRILQERMTVTLFDTEVAYLNFLQDGDNGKREFETLVKELTVGETYFFRHREQFDAFKKIIPSLLQKKTAPETLRVWSAGCSNGAELYSLSILLRDNFGGFLQAQAPYLVGTDINTDSLAKAVDGVYEEWSLRGVAPDERTRFFERTGKRLRVKNEYRQNVHFRFHNLASDPIPSASHDIFGFDIIFLRNVLIYFDNRSLKMFLEKIHAALVPGGYLAVSPAEVGPTFEHWFEAVPFEGGLLYRRPEGKKASETAPKTPSAAASTGSLGAPKFPAVNTDEVTLEAAMAGANQGKLSQSRTLLEKLVKKDSLNYEAHYYLGLVNQNLGDMVAAKENLRQVLFMKRDFLLAMFHLGLIHLSEGNVEEAQRFWESAERNLARCSPTEMIYAREQLTAGDLLGMVRGALGTSK